MKNEKIKVEKTFENGLSLSRGPGYGSSESWTDFGVQEKLLPDEGARININKPFSRDDQFIMRIHFGYTSPSHKNYSRDIRLGLSETIKLIEYLNESVFNHVKNTQP